jgi:hypothetical protein
MHDADRYHQEVVAGPLTEAVVAVGEALDVALALDPSTTTGHDLDAAVRLLGEVQARVDALDARAVGEWDGQMRWAGHGSRSAAAALAHARRVPVDACRQAPRLARKLRELPAVAAAWEAGRISTSHVQRIVAADNPRVHDQLVADQVQITRWAMSHAWGPFCRLLREWLDEHDLDGAEPDGRSRRRFHCSKTLNDAYAVEGWLDPIGGSIFAKELERLVAKLYEDDLAEARERLGIPEPLPFQLRRTPEQRRADALVLMAERSATGPEDGRRGRVLLTVLVGHDSLAKVLEATNGIALRAVQLVPWLDALVIEQVLFDGPGHVVKVSTQRNFEGVVRKAVEVRDRGCQHPTCDEPIDRCQVDHIIPWSASGPTSQENGRLLCGHHNRLRHRRPPPERRGEPGSGDDPDH